MVVYIIKNKENHEDSVVYIGSTQTPLWNRWTQHLAHYRQYKRTGKMKYSSAIVIEKYGIDGCVIEKLESVPSNENMYDKEWFYIQKYKVFCVNKVRPAGISDKSVPYRL